MSGLVSYGFHMAESFCSTSVAGFRSRFWFLGPTVSAETVWRESAVEAVTEAVSSTFSKFHCHSYFFHFTFPGPEAEFSHRGNQMQPSGSGL